MQGKKDNNNNNKEISLIKISIKDGYQKGDILNLDTQDVNFVWNAEDKELLIPAESEDININNILNHISLKSLNVEDERFIEVEYITKDGEVVPLKEYVLNMHEEEIITDKYISEETIISYDNKDVDLEQILLFDYKENQGADFLENSVEETVPYEINLDEEGDIYKILKDSFKEGQDLLEIHGYDISHDKVSLEEFSKEFAGAFNYEVLKDQDNLNLNIFVENHEYNIVLKDVISESDASLDDIIQNLIINSGEHKI